MFLGVFILFRDVSRFKLETGFVGPPDERRSLEKRKWRQTTESSSTVRSTFLLIPLSSKSRLSSRFAWKRKRKEEKLILNSLQIHRSLPPIFKVIMKCFISLILRKIVLIFLSQPLSPPAKHDMNAIFHKLFFFLFFNYYLQGESEFEADQFSIPFAKSSGEGTLRFYCFEYFCFFLRWRMLRDEEASGWRRKTERESEREEETPLRQRHQSNRLVGKIFYNMIIKALLTSYRSSPSNFIKLVSSYLSLRLPSSLSLILPYSVPWNANLIMDKIEVLGLFIASTGTPDFSLLNKNKESWCLRK